MDKSSLRWLQRITIVSRLQHSGSRAAYLIFDKTAKVISMNCSKTVARMRLLSALICNRALRFYDVVAVATQEIVDCLQADADRARGLVFIQVLEGEVRRAGPLDDPLDHAINRRIVTALEARYLKCDEIRMAGPFRRI